MKNPMQVLRSKEQEIIRVKREIEALRTTARLLDEESDENSQKNDQKQDLRHLVEMP